MNSKKLKKKLVVVDLDGTFIHCNSFRLFILFLLKEFLCEFRILELLYLVFLAGLRTLRLCRHSKLKFLVLKHFTPIHDRKIDTFIRRLETMVNKKVRNFLGECKKEGMVICLATAAPAFYANGMRRFFDFDFVLGTLNPEKHHSWVENIREEKLRSVIHLAVGEALVIDTVISDHFNDLPLLEICKNAVLVNATQETTALLVEKGITFRQLQ